MSTPEYQIKLTPEAYLEGEQESEIRHEYINGDVYAMTGVSEAHNLIAGNMLVLLHTHLRGTPRRTFISDMKVQIKKLQDERYYYPDIQVVCDPEDREPYIKKCPKLVIEVLSPSTERIDRAEKFEAYRQLDCLQEYVLIAQDTRRVEIYRRLDNWSLALFQNEEAFHLQSVDLMVTLDAVYEEVNL
jgi:Uma2 family endonuclease